APEALPAVASLYDVPQPAPLPPSRLRIPSLGVDAPVSVKDVDATGTMESPNGPSDVAWYAFSAYPGNVGNAVFSGHRDYYTGVVGVFYNLDQLQLGQEIDVVRNGRILRYHVIDSR